MNRRHFIYIVFLSVYLLCWGLIPFEKDLINSFFSNNFCVDFIVRSFPAIMLSAIVGICAIEGIFILKKRFKNKTLWIFSTAVLICLSASSFFISGQNLEVGCNLEQVHERLWFIELRTVIIEDEDIKYEQITKQYRDEGCFRYYKYNGKEYRVFRGLGFGMNLTEKVH